LVGAMPSVEPVELVPVKAAWQLLPESGLALGVEDERQPSNAVSRSRAHRCRHMSPASGAAGLRPPDVSTAVSELVYPGRRGAIVRFSGEMLGTEFMVSYPWSAEYGWIARN